MKIFLSALFLVGLWSCENSLAPTASINPLDGMDPHSYAKPSSAVVKHLDWDANISFQERRIDAVATWTINTMEENASFILDIHRLSIKNVSLNGEPVDYKIGDFDETLGAPLTIQIPGDPGEYKVAIQYRVPSSAKALFWAQPEQTHDKKQKFLFTQSQAILARTWLPCQDSPGIRFTYNATVKVPKNSLALMSAENPTEKNTSGKYQFKMSQPIPAYLMALAVGDVEFQSLGANCGVYAEPGLLGKAAYEFGDLEKMIQAAERLYGAYAWERYDILVLPSSFPFGGMENPRLTFATPTIIAGDRSLVSLVAHELAHSWSGNLVTNATWNDFWLNEGFTVYFEMRIMEAVQGKGYANMLADLSFADLKSEVEDLGASNADTKLLLDLDGRDPDEGMTSIAYDKGFYLLKLIEQKWGRNNWDNFLRDHFGNHKFETITTTAFLDRLKSKMGEGLYNKIGVERWVYEPGIPDNIPHSVSDRFLAVDQVSENWYNGKALSSSRVAAWSTHEWLRFLQNIKEGTPADKLKTLDRKFDLSNTGNAEIASVWYQKSMLCGYKDPKKQIASFLTEVGRRKFVAPIFKSLLNNGEKEFANELYQEVRPGYHAVTQQTIDDLLNYN